MAALASSRFTETRRRERYPGLAGAWGFDEGSGLTAVDSSSVILTPLTVGAGMTWATGHSVGTAIENPNGAGGAGGAFVARNINSTTMTIMGWAKPTDLTSGSNRPLFGFWDNSNISGSTWMAIWAQRGDYATSNVLQGNVRAAGTLNALNASALTLNTWTHLALTYNATDMILYKDGSPVVTASLPGTPYTGSAFFNIAPNSAYAQIDDVRIFETSLSQAEIQSFMQLPVALP